MTVSVISNIGQINYQAEYGGIQRTRFSCSICCLSVTENPTICHMSIHGAQTFPAKLENMVDKEDEEYLYFHCMIKGRRMVMFLDFSTVI